MTIISSNSGSIIKGGSGCIITDNASALLFSSNLVDAALRVDNGYSLGGDTSATAFENLTGLRLTRAVTTGSVTVQTSSSGICSNIPTNGARFGKANNTWDTGLVIEEQRLNIARSNPINWTGLSGVTRTSILGPDGLQNACQIIDPDNALNNIFTAVGGHTTGSRMCSTIWVQNVSNTGVGAIVATTNNPGFDFGAPGRLTNWTPTTSSGIPTVASTTYQIFPSITANDISTINVNFINIELGSFPTEVIGNTGLPSIRPTDILFRPSGQNLINSTGQLRIEFSFRPKGNIFNVGGGLSGSLLSDNSNLHVYYTQPSSGSTSVILNGITSSFPVSMSFSANDLVDTFFVIGNGKPSGYYRLNNGATVNMGTGSLSQTSITGITSSLYLMSNSGSNAVSSWFYKVNCYRDMLSPSWVTG
jgi:hypothetical protein